MWRSNKHAIVEFIESSVWQDILDILKEREIIAQRSLECRDFDEDVWKDIRRVAADRAKLEELRYLQNLPGFLLGNIEELKKMKEEESENG